MFHGTDKVLNFDSIIRDEWIEKANELFGPHGGIGLSSSRIRPYLERESTKTGEVLFHAMRTIKDSLPATKKKVFQEWCLGNTVVDLGTRNCF